MSYTPARILEAAQLIKATYATHGRCTLSCDCGGWEAYIDADAIGTEADSRKVADLIEHARHDHISPRNIIATLPPVVVFNTAELPSVHGHDLTHEIVIQDAANSDTVWGAGASIEACHTLAAQHGLSYYTVRPIKG